MGQKMKFFNFELEEKLDRHSDVEFDGESDGDSPKIRTQSNCASRPLVLRMIDIYIDRYTLFVQAITPERKEIEG